MATEGQNLHQESCAATVFIVDDDSANRRTLAMLLQSVGLQAKTFDSARAFIQAYDQQQHGCLILDVRMPGMSGPELQAELARRGIEMPIIFLSAFAEVSLATQAMRAGAVDFLQKPYCIQTILERVNEALEQDRLRRRRKLGQDHIRGILAQLSHREYEVMSMLVNGDTTKCIAHTLSISPKTVDNHRTKIYEKLKVDSPSALTKLVLMHLKEHDATQSPSVRSTLNRLSPASADLVTN